MNYSTSKRFVKFPKWPPVAAGELWQASLLRGCCAGAPVLMGNLETFALRTLFSTAWRHNSISRTFISATPVLYKQDPVVRISHDNPKWCGWSA